MSGHHFDFEIRDGCGNVVASDNDIRRVVAEERPRRESGVDGVVLREIDFEDLTGNRGVNQPRAEQMRDGYGSGGGFTGGVLDVEAAGLCATKLVRGGRCEGKGHGALQEQSVLRRCASDLNRVLLSGRFVLKNTGCIIRLPTRA